MSTGSGPNDAAGFMLLAADLEGDGVDDLVIASPAYGAETGRFSIALFD